MSARPGVTWRANASELGEISGQRRAPAAVSALGVGEDGSVALMLRNGDFPTFEVNMAARPARRLCRADQLAFHAGRGGLHPGRLRRQGRSWPTADPAGPDRERRARRA